MFNYKNDDSRTKGEGKDYLYLTTDLSHQVLPFLKVGISNRLSYTNQRSKPSILSSLGSMSPLTKVYNDDGSLNRFPLGDPLTKNPYVNENDDCYKDKTEEWKNFLRLFAEIKLCRNFTYNTNFHITRRSPHVVIIMIIGVRLLRMILIQQEFIIIEKQAGLGIMS